MLFIICLFLIIQPIKKIEKYFSNIFNFLLSELKNVNKIMKD